MKQNLLLFTFLFAFSAYSQDAKPFGFSYHANLKDTADEPYVLLGNISGTKASVADILANPRLVVLPQPKEPKDAIHLHSFTMTIITSGQKQTFETTYGYRFTAEQIALIKNLRSGDVIIIDGINGKKLTENLRSFPPIKLQVQ